MIVLTYHGDDTIIRVFHHVDQAIAYAVAEVQDCSGVDKPVVLTAEEAFAQHSWKVEGVSHIILDNDWGNLERVYTIEDVEVDPTYEPKFS